MSTSPRIAARELAQRVGGTLHGDTTRVVCSVATLDEAEPTDLSWLGERRYVPAFLRSRAGVVLVPLECEVPAGRTVIRVADPNLALCAALTAFQRAQEPIPAGVDAAARVDPTALVEGACIGPFVTVGARTVIGPGTQLHPGVYVGADSRVGRDCLLWPNVVVREHTVIGDRVLIHANATLGADGFGFIERKGRHVRIPQIGHVVIEDDVEIGANTCVDRARSGVTQVGRGTKIDNLVQIGHNVRIGEDCIVVGQCGISGSVTLGHHVVLAGQVGVADHAKIGDRVTVAAQSGVLGELPPGKLYRGTPVSEHTDYARQTINLRRLPELAREVRELSKRIQQLESAANHPTRS